MDDVKPESIPPSPYNYPIYDDGKYALYRDWWNLHRPIKKKPPVRPCLKQMVHFENNSSLDAELFTQLDQLSSPLRRNIGRIHIVTNLDKRSTPFEQGQAIAVSDASVSDDGHASHSYTQISKNEKHRLHGSAPVGCDEDDVESTSAENSGVLALLTIINIFESLSSTTTQPITMYYENDEAVKNAHDLDTYNHLLNLWIPTMISIQK